MGKRKERKEMWRREKGKKEKGGGKRGIRLASSGAAMRPLLGQF